MFYFIKSHGTHNQAEAIFQLNVLKSRDLREGLLKTMQRQRRSREELNQELCTGINYILDNFKVYNFIFHILKRISEITLGVVFRAKLLGTTSGSKVISESKTICLLSSAVGKVSVQSDEVEQSPLICYSLQAIKELFDVNENPLPVKSFGC